MWLHKTAGKQGVRMGQCCFWTDSDKQRYIAEKPFEVTHGDDKWSGDLIGVSDGAFGGDYRDAAEDASANCLHGPTNVAENGEARSVLAVPRVREAIGGRGWC